VRKEKQQGVRRIEEIANNASEIRREWILVDPHTYVSLVTATWVAFPPPQYLAVRAKITSLLADKWGERSGKHELGTSNQRERELHVCK